MKYALVKNDAVTNVVVWDGETPVDFGDGFNPVALDDDQIVDIGYRYENGGFSKPPMSDEDIAAQQVMVVSANLAKKNILMAEAGQNIAVLQDAVDLEMATDEEVAALLLWKKYRVLLSRVNAETSDDIAWPEKPS